MPRRTDSMILSEGDVSDPDRFIYEQKMFRLYIPRWRRLMSSISATLTMTMVGTVYGWTTAALLHLTSGASDVPLKLTNDESSWMVSLTILGSMIGSLVAAQLSNRIGRTSCLVLCNTMFTLGWVIIYISIRYTTFTTLLYLARLGQGIGVGIAHMINPIYVSEIVNIRMRNSHATHNVVTIYCGSLLTCNLGLWLKYNIDLLIIAVLCTISLLLNMLYPETPYCLMIRGRIKEALKSIKHYRGVVEPEVVKVAQEVLHRERSKHQSIRHQISQHVSEHEQSGNDFPSQPRDDLPSTSASDLPSTPKSDSPLTPKSNSPLTPKSDSPLTPKSDLPGTSGSDLPSTPKSDLPSTSRSDLPSTPKSDLPGTSGSDLPSTPKTDLPSTSRSDLPSTPKSDLPGTSGSDLPSTSRSDLPSTSGGDLPSESRSDLPSLSIDEVDSPCKSDLPSTSGGDLPSESRSDLPSESRSDLPSQSRSDLPPPSIDEVDSPCKSDLPSTSGGEIPSESRSDLPSESRSDLPSESRSDLPSESRSDLPSESRSDLPSTSRSDLPTQSRSDLPSQTRSDLSPPSRRGLPSPSRRHLHSPTKRNLYLRSRSGAYSPSKSDIPGPPTTSLMLEAKRALDSVTRRNSPPPSGSASLVRAKSGAHSQSRSDIPGPPTMVSWSKARKALDSITKRQSLSPSEIASLAQPRSDLPSTSRSDLPTTSSSNLPLPSKSDLPSQSRSVLRGQSNVVSSELNETDENIIDLGSIDSSQYSLSTNLRNTLRGVNRKALFIMLGLIMAQHLSGNFITMQYLAVFFSKTRVSIGPYFATVLVLVFRVLSGTITSLSLRSFGRLTLLISSTFGVFITLSILALYLYLDAKKIDVSMYEFLPLIVLIVYQVLFQIGLGTIPNVLLYELFLKELQGFVRTILVIFDGIIGFTVSKLYQVINDDRASYTTYTVFAISSLLAFLMVCLCVPETKGKTYNEIEENLRRKRFCILESRSSNQ